ncbi:MAG: hypothetical protein Fur009_3700 [Candidatus Microgenomates bacterium]
MINLILVCDNKRKALDYLKNYLDNDFILFEILPEKEKFSINDIRKIKKEIFFINDKLRVYFFENFHNSSLEAQNAFLKILEETPKNVLFVLTVDNQYQLLPTILSRGKIVDLIKKNKTILPEKKLILNKFVNNSKLELKLIEEITIDDLILFLKENLDSKNYNLILKETLEIKSLIEKNNLNPRLALDHLFIKLFDFTKDN